MKESVTREMIKMASELAMRAVTACASEYGFDAKEAIRNLGLEDVRVRSNDVVVVKEKRVRSKGIKTAFPLPFSGVHNADLCNGIRQNCGLYTQCPTPLKEGQHYCGACQIQANRNSNGKPDYGTMQDRMNIDIMEYTDPKGRPVTPYWKIMRKFSVSKEQVLEEAGKYGIAVHENHFEFPENPKKVSAKKEAVVKTSVAKKGRPKKDEKVVEIVGDQDDLFETLVAQANTSDDEEEEEEVVIKKVDKKAEKEAKRAQEKAEKEAKRAQEKAEKLAQEKAEKEAKRAQEKAEKLAQEKAEKEAKRAQEKAEKEAQEKANKEKSAKKAVATPEPAPETASAPVKDTVHRFEYKGTKYLKSKVTNIVYNTESDVVGKWDVERQEIIFNMDDSEEEQEDYEEDEEEESDAEEEAEDGEIVEE
jgi:flagellar biosynthesis GTPase FlhF